MTVTVLDHYSLAALFRYSAEPDDRVGRGNGRGRGGLNRRWGSERNTNVTGWPILT